MTLLEKHAFEDALFNAGRRPTPDLLQNIVGASEAYKRPLLNLFSQVQNEDLSSFPPNEPKRYVGVVIGRLLIQMKAIEAIPLIGELYSKTWGEDVTVDGLDRDPAAFGLQAIPIFSNIAKMHTLNKWHYGKAVSITILTDIALADISGRNQIQRCLRDLLPPLNANGGISVPKDEMWGDIALALGKLQDQTSYNTIVAMLRQGVIDSTSLTRDRYERFYKGKQKPRQPEPFNIFRKYESTGNFEDMMHNMLGAPEAQSPHSAQDFVSKAKQIEDRKKTVRTKPQVGRNAPCACGSGKKYKHCCGKK